MRSRSFLIALSSLFISNACVTFGSPNEIKIYSIQPDTEYCREPWCEGEIGLIRKQDREVKHFKDAKGYFALSPDDLKKIEDRCPSP